MSPEYLSTSNAMITTTSTKFRPEHHISKLVLSWASDQEDEQKLNLVSMDFYGSDGNKFKEISCALHAVAK